MKSLAVNLLIFAVSILCVIGASILNQHSKTSPPTPSPPLRKDSVDTFFADEIERSLTESQEDERPTHKFALPLHARAESLLTRSKISERDIKAHPKTSAKAKGDKGYFFLDSNKLKFAATKLGLDYKHHFLNSFLVGYHPFHVSEIWMPHQVLNMRLKYQLDKEQFAGFQEIWLSSYQAFQTGRGDCEDHSIALADWLIEMGEDARVVTGTHNGGGHAWVVVIRESGSFLLEATSKRRQRLWSSYPLTSLARGYAPTAMFNRDYYWTNNDPSKPTDYTGPHWTKAGKVIR